MNRSSPTHPRLLVLTSTFPESESDHTPRFVLDLAQQLDRRFEITILAPHAPKLPVRQKIGRLQVERFRYLPQQLERLTAGGGIPDRLRGNPLNFFAVPFFLVAQLIATCRAIRRFSPNAIHAHWWMPQGFTAILAAKLTRRQVPIICTLHGADVFAFQGGLIKRLMAAVLHRCNRVCPASVTIRKQLPNPIRSKSSTITAPMGVDLDKKFRPIPGARPDYSSVLYVGRLAEKKGLEWLLTAFAVSTSQERRVSLIIAGDGVLKKKLSQLAEELQITDSVHFLGALPHTELPKLYSSAGMTVVPSIRAPGGDQEGFGLTAVEALACGCPVIASDTPSLLDIVRHGENGTIVTQHDHAALANSICDLARNPHLQKRLRSNARRSVLHFSWTQVGDRYARLITDSINEQAIFRSSAP